MRKVGWEHNFYYVLTRLFKHGRYKRVLLERLTEPIHLNIISFFVAMFGNYKTKVAFDLVVRQQYAFSLLYAANVAKVRGYHSITVLEFGVAAGAGLLNLCYLARRTADATGVKIHVVGFDRGGGMPPPVDYRDIPEIFREGDFPMDVAKLQASLPSHCKLMIGEISDTVANFISTLPADEPIGFISLDVDYYSSTVSALNVLKGDSDKYLPIVLLYLDDIGFDSTNPWNGELLAVNEFNAEQPMRKIAPFTLLRSKRIFKNPQWIDQIYAAHVHDHRLRSESIRGHSKIVMPNEYLSMM